jgi:inner membrane protein
VASFGHIAVGLAAGRLYRSDRPLPWMVAFSVLSLLPDADVVAFVLRIPYEAPFGHRGASHSIAFAALCGLVALAVSRSGRLAWFVGLVVLSHPVLDMLTDGGLGCALLFPVSTQRLFWPWRPIPVAPIGAGMLSARGLWVVVVEVVVFAPLLIVALWKRRASDRR